MPSVSKQQFKFFEVMKHNPEEAKKKGISPRVANEYTQGMTKGRFAKLKDKISKK